MTGSTVMCISKKVADIFKSDGWKKIKIFFSKVIKPIFKQTYL